MAEAHPVGFQWVAEAQRRGAKVIHVDPRFTRTSAFADLHVPLRAGTDIAFLGGIINHVLTNGREFREYVVNYTNAPVIVGEDFRDTEDLDGFFSGFDPDSGSYDVASWQYEGMTAMPSAGKRQIEGSLAATLGASGAPLESGCPPAVDETLQHPRCVFQLLKRHFSRYTPEMVSQICGVPRELFVEVAEALCDNSGRERTSAFAYAVGWTHHSVGVQYIRTAAILQTLLGNIGRPGGGILALRGHASIQGSTDIPTLFNLLPGYIPMPHTDAYGDLQTYVERNSAPTGYWGNMQAYMVSLLRAWFGDAATESNDWGFDWLPRISSDHSTLRTTLDMLDGKVRGYFAIGENPAVGSAHSKAHRLGFANLDWLVVRDLVEVETATFWRDSQEIETGELRTTDIATEVFFFPASAHVEKDGSFTNTQRLLQWHHKAVEPTGDQRSDLWFYFHLGRLIKQRLADSTDERDQGLRNLTWEYPTQAGEGGDADPEWGEPSAEAVLAEINGWDADGTPLSSYTQLKADGSTVCGCWIYCGCYADGVNQTARRKPWDEQSAVAPEWAWAWPDNRRLLYNRASADPEGNPWSERKRYVWWDAEQGSWTGEDTPDFKADKAPDYVPDDDATGPDALRGDDPFIMQADGLAWLYVPSGLTDGPFPTHYEPHESPVDNPLYGVAANPTRQVLERGENPSNPSFGQEGTEAYPYVMTTFRLTEHHTAGGMSRSVGHLAELQPEMFCEVSPELAAERGLEHGGWATIVSSRSAIEARVMVTERLRPLQVNGQALHQVGLPWHWGRNGTSTGDTVNDLFGIVMDSNVHIHETKASSCDIRPGRRPRGPALLDLLATYPGRVNEQRVPGGLHRDGHRA